jgi:hypothetical protein
MVAIPVVALVRVTTTPTAVTATTSTTAVVTGRPALELLVLFLDIGKKVFTELLGFLHLLGIRTPIPC